MKLYKPLLIIASLLFACSPHYLATTKGSSIIPGNWALTKHTITKKGMAVDRIDRNRISTYTFFRNGTYQLTDKYLKSQYKETGKWKIIESGKKLHLFDINKVPNYSKVFIANHNMNIIMLKKVYYLTFSWTNSQVAPETDYFKKK